MVVKQGYKQTDIGIFPEDWHIYRYADIGQVIDGDRGHHYPSKDELKNDGFCLFLNAGNVTRFGFRFDHCEFISRTKNNALSKGKLARNDIVLTTRGTLGNFAVYLDDIKFEHIRINSGMVILRNRSESNSIRFQYEMLRSHVLRHQIERISFGSAQPQLTVGGINDLLIPLPRTLAEQETIAGALSDADAWIESLEQLIGKKRQIKQGAMQELLTGKRRLPGFSGQWETKRLGDIALLRNGYPFKSDTYAVLGSFKVVTIANVQDGRMEMAECNSLEILPRDLQVHHQLSVGDLLISMTGNVGRVCRVSHPNCLLNQRVGLVVPLSTSVEFLYNLLSQRFFLAAMARKAKGGAQGNLSKGDILEFEITIPNSLNEQQSIATVLSDMDTEIESLESKLGKAREIKQGMMQELLTGKIRLV
jgi:type I restriction enzyme S subunit